MSARFPHVKLASGRYTVYGEIASGGMASILYGQLLGALGFSRAVAIKRLHPQFAKDPNFVSMFLDEARLSARIAHANVVQTIDVLSEPGELSVIMEYVHGESLARLLDRCIGRGEQMPVRIAVTLLVGVLHGLHAAHETRGEHGEPLHIVHRDVSPENILVGADGLARLIDFGIARAQGRSRVTPAGELKGKLAYMACEQFRGEQVDRRVDVYGASVVLWEALCGRELFSGESDAAVVGAVMSGSVLAPSALRPELPEALDRIVLRGLSRERDQRFSSAREMALALEREVGIGSQSEVADWLESVAGDLLAQRAELLRRMRMASEGDESASTPITRRVEASATPAETREPTPELPRERAPTPAASAPPFDTDVSALERDTRVHVRVPELGDEATGALTRVAPVLLAGGVHEAAFAATRVTPPPAGAHPSQDSARVRRRTWPLLALLALACAGVGVWLHGRRSTEESRSFAVDTRAPVAKPPSHESAPLRPSSPPPRAALVPAAPTTSAPAPSHTLASASGSDAAVALPTRAANELTPREKPRATKRSAPKVDCSEPFVVDARGVRHVKRACLDD